MNAHTNGKAHGVINVIRVHGQRYKFSLSFLYRGSTPLHTRASIRARITFITVDEKR